MSRVDFAKDTSVSVDRTRGQIMELLSKVKCEGRAFLEEGDVSAIQFKLRGRVYQLRVVYHPWSRFASMTDRHGYRLKEAQVRKKYEQHQRTRWRALLLLVKALLVQVEMEYMTVEEAFLPYLALPSGKTWGEESLEALDRIQTEGTMFLLPAPGGAS